MLQVSDARNALHGREQELRELRAEAVGLRNREEDAKREVQRTNAAMSALQARNDTIEVRGPRVPAALRQPGVVRRSCLPFGHETL